MKLKSNFKRILSGVMSVAMAATLLPSLPAVAEEAAEKYPYTMFAASDTEGSITINANNFCVNGNIATNGTIVSNGNLNVNGTKTENAGKEMIYIFDKIDSAYFSGNNIDEYSQDYTLEEINININDPLEVEGNATLTGNININTALKAFEDVTLNGEVKNTNNSVIFSKYGDIVIDSQNVNLNGLVYAPFGNVEIMAQNLNLNNVVIIADTITFNCPSVNANYSGNAGELVGTVSEPLDIPVDEWQYMKDENDNGLPDFFEDMNNWELLKDTDGDKLPDCVEQYLGSDSTLVDTDGDLLDDYYEVFVTGTDPTLIDTDENGITDGDEDFDEDGLTNLQEYELGTEPYNDDTDGDGLNDGEEINTYNTDPLKKDTDDDGLEDGDEIYLETDPTNPDTNENGILDGDEKRLQTFIHKVENEDCAVTEVRVSMEGTGNLQKTTTVESIMNKDILCSEVVGLVGEPFEIKTTSQFDKATLTYVIDKSKLGDTEFDNLLFLWYDEENDNFVELDTILDEKNSTVSVETTHFSKYMIVDGKEWYRAWQDIYTKINESKGQHIPNATVLISKSSNIYNVNNANRNELIVSNIVDSMSDSDIMSFLTYQNAGGMNTDFTSVKSALKWDPIYYSRTANASYGIGLAAVILNDEAMGYNSKIIFITDSSVSVDSRFLKLAINNKIPIYFFCIGDFNTAALIGYAQLTGGKVYSAKTAAEINQSCNEIGPKTFVGETDTDGDGFTDIEEMSGLIVSSNCKIVNTDYMKADTDDDGLDDNEEVDVELTKVEVPGKQGNPSTFKYYHHMWSDPSDSDTDGDRTVDSSDLNPLVYSFVPYLDILCEYAQNYCSDNNLRNKDDEITLVLEFLRSTKYIGTKWNITAGNINENFIAYVKDNNIDVYNYFLGDDNAVEELFDPLTNEKYDLKHLAATMNAYFEKNDIKSIYSTYYGSMNDMAGWAGDLQQVIDQDILYGKDQYYAHNMSIEAAYQEMSTYLGNRSNSHYGISDVIVDADAVNLYYEYKDNPNMDLNELLNNYLIKMNNKQRFSDFIYNITGSNERSDLKILATSYIRPPMDFLSAGCVYSSSTCNLITENMIYGFASAFCDYYFDLAN